jgi:putative transposase
MMSVHRSGYYAWRKQPQSPRQVEDARVLGLIKQAWLESGCVYGYRKIHDELRSLGEKSCRNRIARLMKQESLKAQVGYKKPRYRGGTVAPLSANLLEQKFTAEGPNQAWVTDITYIRTADGWLFLAVVIDLFSRQVVGWSMQPRMQTDLVLQALLMAVWRRKPEQRVVVHSDQGSQYTSEQFQRLMADNGVTCSMSRSGNVWDNAAMESFFSSLKTERTARKTYRTRDQAMADVFDYIERFYNARRRHSTLGYLSPMEFEMQEASA